jgi:MFS superfamily sulfate permease-like transporter
MVSVLPLFAIPIFMFKHLKKDLPASIVVFLVALPLCLGIALASGAPPLAGLIAGILGGLVVAPISGSAVGVSGPAAGLAVIVLNGINTLPSYEVFLLAVVIGGLVQLVLGALKAGIIGLYFPSSVIQGMLSGIGIIIFLKQIPHALGYDADTEGDMSFQQTDGQNTFSELAMMLDNITPTALLISVLGLAALILWERPFMKKLSLTTILPGSLMAVLIGVGIHLATLGSGLTLDQLVQLPVIGEGDYPTIGSIFRFPDFSAIGSSAVWTLGITIAIVASLETLLCVEATDKLDPHKRITPTNRELIAQGVGNTLSGLIGGLPITQVIVRSSANIQTGNETKMSAILHGLWLAVLFLLVPKVLNLVPLSSLAAVLLVVGYKLAKPATFIQIYKRGGRQFVPFVVTVLGIVFTDLLTGIGIGLVVSVVSILLDHYQRPFVGFRYEKGEGDNPGTWHLELSEDVTFLHKAGLRQALSRVKPGGHVILDASRTLRMDVDVRDVIEDFRSRAKEDDISLDLKSPEDAKVAWVLSDFNKQAS